jgi:hypothetical protein
VCLLALCAAGGALCALKQVVKNLNCLLHSFAPPALLCKAEAVRGGVVEERYLTTEQRNFIFIFFYIHQKI